MPVPEETRATSTGKGTAIFDGWAIARYCRDGENTLEFGSADTGGQRFNAMYMLKFKKTG